MNENKPGTLYIVATPIGNSRDMSPRGMQILEEADMIAAEDTRRSMVLLGKLGIRNKLVSNHKFNEYGKAKFFINAMLNGQSVAVITDAGTPCISDPGNELIKAAVEAGIRVVGVPGCCAAVNALAISGFDLSSFTFFGFFPRERADRRRLVEKLRRGDTRTFALYESPKRIMDLVDWFIEVEAEVRMVPLQRHDQAPRDDLPRHACRGQGAASRQGQLRQRRICRRRRGRGGLYFQQGRAHRLRRGHAGRRDGEGTLGQGGCRGGTRGREQFLQQERAQGRGSAAQEAKAFHENLAEDALPAYVRDNLDGRYRQVLLVSEEGSSQYVLRQNGDYKKTGSGAGVPRPGEGHDRGKTYILREGEAIPALVDLGVFTADYRIVKARYEKYRQINRFVELVDQAFAGSTRRDITILDFGCGKSYLTFILYYYFAVKRGLAVKIIGYDLKEDVVEHCNAIARKYGYDGLRFVHADVSRDALYEEKVDMVVSLHACDTATDYALHYAISQGREPHLLRSLLPARDQQQHPQGRGAGHLPAPRHRQGAHGRPAHGFHPHPHP